VSEPWIVAVNTTMTTIGTGFVKGIEAGEETVPRMLIQAPQEPMTAGVTLASRDQTIGLDLIVLARQTLMPPDRSVDGHRRFLA